MGWLPFPWQLFSLVSSGTNFADFAFGSGRECVKRHRGFPNEYEGSLLTRAAEFHARSRSENEYDEKARHEYETFARECLRLAQQAERNEFVDRAYEPPPPKIRRQS